MLNFRASAGNFTFRLQWLFESMRWQVRQRCPYPAGLAHAILIRARGI
jgi:hypothetical protein